MVGANRMSFVMAKGGILFSVFLSMMCERMSLAVVKMGVRSEIKCCVDGRERMVSWCVCVVIDRSDDVRARLEAVLSVCVGDLLSMLRESVRSVIMLTSSGWSGCC